MIEKQIVDEYRRKIRSGITELDSCFYMPVRITGTGCTKRYDEKTGELFVEERLKAEYFTIAALEHCARLPITINHPNDGFVTNENFKNVRIIGQTIDAWMQGEEIWGLARIYDKSILPRLGKDLGSTSPGISIFHSIITKDKVTEGPIEINHLAFVEKGHWDQVEGSVGFDNSKKERLDSMAEELKQETRATVVPISDVVSPLVQPRVDSEKPEPEVKADGEEEKPDFVEEKKDSANEVIDEEQKTDEEEDVPEVTDEEVEILDGDEPIGPEHHEQPSEPVVDSDDVEILDGEDEEILDSEDEEVEDKEREDALEEIRNTCDSAHPSLGIKMPRIEKRETKRSVVSKFISRNKGFVSSKYQNMRIDSMNSELADEILKDTIKNIEDKSSKLQTKKVNGFVPSQYGAVDRNF